MTWIHAIPWHWLESLAMVLFWGLVIVLALVPINYLREQLEAVDSPPASAADDTSTTHEHGST
ncbi:hypothetical protein [Noviherbaspirillum saxi]|uniref:Uncharacterized protein n=1 Tax=Noviherbaspirillum saxi TaxID=2320863 RepID=A0A3A3FMW4_9BURK|nr:hypothetical protein [Noviherbaspirillum saxi]RJF97243.1 hypothetical protein D3871_00860 [Noviherbaspirillum saxi]